MATPSPEQPSARVKAPQAHAPQTPHALPALPPLPWSDRLPPECDVVIVGGGFSGLLTLVALAEAVPTARVVLVERRPARSPGVAYGACDPVHLLNVPANRMGAQTADPAAFHTWLEQRWPGAYAPGAFAPRCLYGAYLTEFVLDRLKGVWNRVCLVRDAVVHVDHVADGVELLMASGRTCAASAVVLAPGLPPARAPWAQVAAHAPRRQLVADPWDAGAFDGINPEQPVLVVGSGLTAIDVVLSLKERGHRAGITLVSRNGKLPLPHVAPGDPPHTFTREQVAGGPAALMHTLRAAAKARMKAGQGWQPVLDALRPFTVEVWRSWTAEQKKRFLRHARPFWEIHRHRAPREVLARLEAWMKDGSLRIMHGQVAGVSGADSGMLHVQIAPAPRQGTAGDGRGQALEVARVFNCVGPTVSVRQTADPLLRSLIAGGVAASDPAGLGLRVDADGRLLNADGKADPVMFLVGALRRAESWESTAVPELRVQAEVAAHAVAGLLAARGGGLVSRRQTVGAASAEGCG